jgi:hypothetical protein
MTKWLTFEELLEAPTQISLIFEPIEPEPETAVQRARRRWGMKEEMEEPNHVY